MYMTESSIANNASLSNKLQTIPVGEIRLGMLVHAIAEQVGKLSVINKGKVKHLTIIEKLTASGVKSVIVENFPLINEQRKRIKSKKLVSNTRSNSGSENISEFAEASLLLKQSKKMYANYAEKVKKDLSIDFSGTKPLVSAVYQSLAKNPDALLCMSMLMHSSYYLANHAIHVATLICYFAQKLNMSKTECEQLTLVGYLFDIGMVKTPGSIRNKVGQLDDQEIAEIHRHVHHSLDILEPLKLDPQCLLAIEQHHERLDGSGYPNAYSGSKIHKFSRILAIIDCYDALTTMRNHKMPLSPAAAMKVLSNPDYGYDQKLVLQFIRCIGIYPVGSLVILSDKSIALVTKTHKESPTAPEVKVFYSLLGNHFIPPAFINLAEVDLDQQTGKRLRVIKPVLASQYGLNMEQIVS